MEQFQMSESELREWVAQCTRKQLETLVINLYLLDKNRRADQPAATGQGEKNDNSPCPKCNGTGNSGDWYGDPDIPNGTMGLPCKECDGAGIIKEVAAPAEARTRAGWPDAVPEDVIAWMKACEDGKWDFQEAWEQLKICLAPAAPGDANG